MEKRAAVFAGSIEYEMSHDQAIQNMLMGYHLKKIIYETLDTTIYLIENQKDFDLRVLKIMDKSKIFYMDKEILLSISHPNIAKVYAICETKDRIYKIREYVKGQTLEAYVKEALHIEETTVRNIGIKLCKILEYLHDMKPNPVIYRDLKPSNIIINEQGEIKLIDLISCRTFKESSSDDTYHIGTKGYAAPEQYGFGQTNEFTDIYNLGVTMHYLLTKEISMTDQFALKSIQTYRKDVSNKLTKVIERCTKFDPNKRYNKISMVLSGLEKRSFHRKYIFAVGVFCGCLLILMPILFSMNGQQKDGQLDSISEVQEDGAASVHPDATDERKTVMKQTQTTEEMVASIEKVIEESVATTEGMLTTEATLTTEVMAPTEAITTTEVMASTEATMTTEATITTDAKGITSPTQATNGSQENSNTVPTEVETTTSQQITQAVIRPMIVPDFEANWVALPFVAAPQDDGAVQNIKMERYEDANSIYIRTHYTSPMNGMVSVFLAGDYPGLSGNYDNQTQIGENLLVLKFDKKALTELIARIERRDVNLLVIRLVSVYNVMHYIYFSDLLGY